MITWRLFLTSRNKLTRSSKTGPRSSRLRRSRQSKGALQCRRATNEDAMLELVERQQGCGEVYAMRPNLEGSRPRVHYRWHSPPRSQRRKNRAVCLANSGTRLDPLEVEFRGATAGGVNVTSTKGKSALSIIEDPTLRC